MKRCPKCKETKPTYAFPPSKATKDGLYGHCKPCAAAAKKASLAKPGAKARLRKAIDRWRANNKPRVLENERWAEKRRNFGVTKDQFEKMMEEQAGGCAICGGVNKDRALAIDHCHKTKKVRALLCGECNTGLGKFKDNPAQLRKAALYLEKHSDT